MRVVGRLQQEWRDRAQQGRLAHPRRAVRGQIARHLAGAHREADQDDVGQIEVLEQRVQVGRERVVVVTHRWLARATEPAAVIADTAITGGKQLALLALPRVAVERVAVDQHDRLAAAVVLVVNLDRSVVLGSNSDARHVSLLVVGC